MKYRILATVLVAMGSLAFANPAGATTDTDSRVGCRIGNSHSWSRLGGDSVWSAGVKNSAQLSVIVRSSAGQRSLICIGLNQAERKAVTSQAVNAKPCTMRWGQKFIAMAFHSDGASVDRPTTFTDPRFKAGAAAFCLTVKVRQGKQTVTIRLLWPRLCVNAALISQVTTSSKKKAPPAKVKPQPQAPACTIVIVNSPGAQATCKGNNTGTCNGVGNCVVQVVVACPDGRSATQTFTGASASAAQAAAQAWAQAWVVANCVPAPTPPPCCPQPPPPPPPPSPPPSGKLRVHERIVNTTAPVCVDEVKNTSSADFWFSAGQWGPVYQQSPDVWCVSYTTPGIPGEVVVRVTLHGPGGSTPLEDRIPVVSDQF